MVSILSVRVGSLPIRFPCEEQLPLVGFIVPLNSMAEQHVAKMFFGVPKQFLLTKVCPTKFAAFLLAHSKQSIRPIRICFEVVLLKFDLALIQEPALKWSPVLLPVESQCRATA